MQFKHAPAAVSAMFDDPNLVSAAGLVPMLRLARSAGLDELAQSRLSVPTDKGANAGGKVMALVAGMLAGADSIDDMNVLRHGGMGRLFDRMYAPSTLGSFLREFRFGHVRQLDAVASRTLVNLTQSAPLLQASNDERVMVELICDGVHLAPVVAAMSIDAAGPGRVALVTDAMAATGKGDGRYILGELRVDVHDGTARLVTEDGSPGAIAGSTLTMAGAFRFVVQEVGVSIPDAALMAATTPAAWHGLSDVGRLAPGLWADICLVDDDGDLHGVLRRGDWVVAAP